MLDNLVETKTPIVLNISTHVSKIAQKLNFLAQGIKNQKDADTKSIYIECFEEERETNKNSNSDDISKTEMVKVIRLSTDVMIWTEIAEKDAIMGELLPRNVSVNLYDFYNIINNCTDDMISLRLDEEKSELVVGCFYNDMDGHEYDELEVYIKTHSIGFSKRELLPIDLDTFHNSFHLSHVAIYKIIEELNTEQRTDGVNIIVSRGKLLFQSNYNGLKINLKVKEYDDMIFLKDFKVFIPFYVFNLIAGSNNLADVFRIKFDVYDKYLVVYTDDYTFVYKIEDVFDEFLIDTEKLEDLLVVEPENMVSCIQLLNRINKPAKISNAVISKASDTVGDISVEYEGRYTASAAVDMAMLSDTEVTIDSDILESIFTKTKVDGVRVKWGDGGNIIYIKYENQLIENEICYDHYEFNKYRKDLLKGED